MSSSHQMEVKVNIRNFWLMMSVFVALLSISFQVSDTEWSKVNVDEEASVRGAWPSFVIVKDISDESYCLGSLISEKHVLVGGYCGAYCIYNYSENRTCSPKVTVVILGAFNPSSTNDEGVVRANVTKFHVHPDWSRKRNSGDANLAILVLSDDITFTDYIRPARLPAADDVAIDSSSVDVVGTAAGWSDDSATTQATVRALNCDKMDHTIHYISFHSDRIFCSKYANLGGFFVRRTDDTWVQYGLVFAVDPTYPWDRVSVYTNLKLFTNWIEETIELSESGALLQSIKLLLF